MVFIKYEEKLLNIKEKLDLLERWFLMDEAGEGNNYNIMDFNDTYNIVAENVLRNNAELILTLRDDAKYLLNVINSLHRSFDAERKRVEQLEKQIDLNKYEEKHWVNTKRYQPNLDTKVLCMDKSDNLFVGTLYGIKYSTENYDNEYLFEDEYEEKRIGVRWRLIPEIGE